MDRKATEETFYDRSCEGGVIETQNGFYELSDGVLRDQQLILGGCSGKRVLEYGYGLAGETISLTRRGAFATGIDISEAAVAQAPRRAAKETHGHVTFLKAGGENLQPLPPLRACGAVVVLDLRK